MKEILFNMEIPSKRSNLSELIGVDPHNLPRELKTRITENLVNYQLRVINESIKN